jgi:kumamolisin
VAPLWAGLIARLNALAGKNQGLINPQLSGEVTNDVTEGNNGTFAAAPGWDACTGWGSPVGVALQSVLAPTSSSPAPSPSPTPNPPAPAPSPPPKHHKHKQHER